MRKVWIKQLIRTHSNSITFFGYYYFTLGENILYAHVESNAEMTVFKLNLLYIEYVLF